MPQSTQSTPQIELAAPASGFALEPAGFDEIPGWKTSDPATALAAMKQSCRRFEKLPANSPVSKQSAYNAGVVGDWSGTCAAIARTVSHSANEHRRLFEDYFYAFKIAAPVENSKLTGYFEPMLRVNDFQAPGFETPILRKPENIVTADLSAFEGVSESERIVGKVVDGKLVPYDQRSDIDFDSTDAIAWADAGDVFYLQIQGSGRLSFPDGRQIRAAFAAHNGQPFKSIARHLIDQGEIEPHQAGMSHVKAWMKRVGPKAAAEAMNINPRFVWFGVETINDPGLGPKGAQGAPLTPMGSMAVDPSYHPYGVPIFIESLVADRAGDWRGEPFRSLVVAQDTGGAIKGPLRGDLFFGWGEEAGERAAVTNHPLAMWVLLPRTVVEKQSR